LFVMKVQGQILVNANYYGETIIINAYRRQSQKVIVEDKGRC